MLTKAAIKNFRSLRDVTLELEPLTVLVGPNASGKSSILRAFDPRRPAAEDYWRHDSALPVEFRWWTGLPDQGNGGVSTRGDWVARPYRYAFLHLDPAALRNPSPLADQTALESSGAGLTNLFYSLPRNRQTELAKRFCGLVPVFQDVDTRAVNSGSHELRFQDRWKPEVWYRPNEVSDGSILLLAYLMIDFVTPRPTLLAIEEPERGLHPYLLGELTKGLRLLATGPNPIQTILATHSAELLEFVRPEEVRFLTKNAEDGSVLVEQVEPGTPNWKEAYAAHRESLGSVWLSGGMGGVPAI